MLRVVKTKSSEWRFNLDEKTYIRLPLVEGADHPNIPYTGEWEPFIGLTDLENGCILVQRPVPWGTGQMRTTGTIISDELVDADA